MSTNYDTICIVIKKKGMVQLKYVIYILVGTCGTVIQDTLMKKFH